MQETVKNLGGNVVANYFPDREIEGYGITRTALKKLKSFAPALLVAVRFDDETFGGNARVAFELLQFRNEQNKIEQFLYARPDLGRDRDFAGEFGEYLGALGIPRALAVHDVLKLGMAGHLTSRNRG